MKLEIPEGLTEMLSILSQELSPLKTLMTTLTAGCFKGYLRDQLPDYPAGPCDPQAKEIPVPVMEGKGVNFLVPGAVPTHRASAVEFPSDPGYRMVGQDLPDQCQGVNPKPGGKQVGPVFRTSGLPDPHVNKRFPHPVDEPSVIHLAQKDTSHRLPERDPRIDPAIRGLFIHVDEDVTASTSSQAPPPRGAGTRRRDAGGENRIDETFLMVDILVLVVIEKQLVIPRTWRQTACNDRPFPIILSVDPPVH
jgi:hypothetical protein